jgi:type I restriction enzyme, R subunit
MKEYLSESDVRAKFITPALINAGWDELTQIKREVPLTAGRIYVKGKLHARGKKKIPDYVLYYRQDKPVAVIEAKDSSHTLLSGIQQALDYSGLLDVPIAISSNGEGFYIHDKTKKDNIERTISLSEFPSPDELWQIYKRYKGIDNGKAEQIIEQDFYNDPIKELRYFQKVAVNRAVEAIAKGDKRVLLVMATGTGKTLTAFQIIWRLWKSGAKKRILFLADRIALLDQTRRGDFKHFRDKMTILKKKVITVNGKEQLVTDYSYRRGIDSSDKAYEIFLALYQGLTSYDQVKDAYKDFSRDFFDLVIIDECHRGSADEESEWHEILKYFNAATHLGMTATPKETKRISNIHYFGDPIYTYSLKQGINDGFLAPYKVIKVGIDRDLEGWIPDKGKLDKNGNPVEQRKYNIKDYDRTLVIDERTQLVARKISEFLKGTNHYDKTIVFCVDIDHAMRMREALVRENPLLVAENHKYVMQITGDNTEGRNEIDNFINPEERYPVIATTSKLLSTGIDAQTCKLIVLDSNIQSMTEFKQIIGRGTRINEDFGKYFFTIMDFRNVTEKFLDPEFDGDPVMIYEPAPEDPVVPPDPDEIPIDVETGEEIGTLTDPEPPEVTVGTGTLIHREKIYVDGVEVKILNERVQYYGKDGQLITESLTDYSKKNIQQNFRRMNDFIQHWNESDKKQSIIDELEEQGVLLEELKEKVGRDVDEFDLVCHVAFGMPPLTRKERAENVKKRNYFTRYGDQARKVLEALLDKYADTGIRNIEDTKVLMLEPISRFGTPTQITGYFGGLPKYKKAIRELQKELYKTA